MNLQAGTVTAAEVAREAPPNGYFLRCGDLEVLMPYSEAKRKMEIGERVDVFIYHDSLDRLAATMKQPLLTLGELGLLEVVDIHQRLGCFLEIGLGRNVLLPMSELPESTELHPHVGDKVYVVLEHDRQGRMIARTAGELELSGKTFAAPAAWKNNWVEARVYKVLQMGAFVVCDGGVVGFGVIGLIHRNEQSRSLRLGEQVRVRVTFVREDGRVNLSMKEFKEAGRVQDADRLLTFLQERPNGAMPYSDETPADIIAKRFGMSKAAFKRALGKLMKDELVVQKGSWTHLREIDVEGGKVAGAIGDVGGDSGEGVLGGKGESGDYIGVGIDGTGGGVRVGGGNSLNDGTGEGSHT
jgi:predicted RNA-binding protein (virulence factor B family)